MDSERQGKMDRSLVEERKREGIDGGGAEAPEKGRMEERMWG